MQKGAGDFIGGMKFCPTDVSKIFVASGDGTISLQSFEGSQSQILTSAIKKNQHQSTNFEYYNRIKQTARLSY